MGSRSKYRPHSKQPRQDKVMTIRDMWTPADPLLVYLATIEQELQKKYEEIKILGSPEKAKIEGSLAMLRSLALTVLQHRVIGDLIPLKFMPKEVGNAKTATEAIELSQEQLAKEKKLLGPDARPDSEEGNV
jgi:hypothetical protein